MDTPGRRRWLRPAVPPAPLLAQRARRIADRLADAWLPPRCLVCGAPGQPRLDLCGACESLLPAPHAAGGDHAAGLACHSLWRYAAPVDEWVAALKHHDRQPLARVFGEAMARQAALRSGQRCSPQLLLPVPLHPDRLRRRGFNQAERIAHWAGRALRLPVRAGAARRILDTGSLAERSRAERQLAIRGAFTVEPSLAGRRLAIVDDVLTTGATAGELARECLDTGAAAVELWVVARTAAPER